MIIDNELLKNKKEELEATLSYAKENVIRLEAQIEIIDELLSTSDKLVCEE